MKNNLKRLVMFLVMAVGVLDSICGSVFGEETSTEGTEFWAAFMSNGAVPESEQTLDCSLYFSLKEPAEEDVVIVVAINGWQQNVTIPAGQTFVALEKIPNPSTFYVPINDDTGLYYEMVQSRGLHIYTESDVKFSCVGYCRAGEGGSTTQDAMLILPTEYLGKEYYIQTYWTTTLSTEFIVVATENNTTVTIIPSIPTRKGQPAGQPIDVILKNAGDVYLVPSAKFGFGKTDLSGSKICADKPVAVFTGNEMAKIPVDNSYSADFFMEQMLPLDYWGTEFYMAKAAKTKQNRFNIVAGYDNTVVTMHRSDASTSTEQVQTYTLNAGQTFQTLIEAGTKEAMFQMPSAFTTTYIETSKPALCYAYLTCGGANQESVMDPETFEEITTNWGNPSDAMIPSWNQRIKNISFITRELIPEAGVTVQKHFVQIITSTSDIGTFTLDGVAVDPSSFSIFYGKADMSYANLELTTYGVHQIKTTGDGFVGYVYGMTNGQAYQYTLGYNPMPDRDSLFIQNPEEIMSEHSYDLERLPQGWYQRQLKDWIVKEEARLDTAYVCDSTTLNFTTQLNPTVVYDSVIWRVFKCTPDGQVINPMVPDAEYKSENPALKNQQWDYQFILDPQKDLLPKDRDPFTLYQLQNLLIREHIICPELEPERDTLMTMIHVNRIYNDTILKRMLCVTDSVKCFYDDVTHTTIHDVALDSTTFISKDANPTGDYQEAFELGYNVYRRDYKTIFGCDSIMYFELYVCDTQRVILDTTICENEPLKFEGSQYFQNTNFDHEGQYLDTIKTVGCNEMKAQYDPNNLFHGCDSIFEVNVHICDTFMIFTRDTFCSNGYWDIPYQWHRDGVVTTDSLVRSISFTKNDMNKWFEFRDTVKTLSCPDCDKGGCDSIFVLNLFVAPYYIDTSVVANCGQHYNPEKGELELISYSWDECTSDYVWDKNQGRRILKSEIQNTALNVPNVFIDSLLSVNGCDSISVLSLTRHKAYLDISYHRMANNETYVWRGKTYGPLVESTQPYIFHDSILSGTVHNCDSIYRLELTIGKSFEATTSVSICDDSTFVWEKHTSTNKYDGSAQEPRQLWDRTRGKIVYSNQLYGSKVKADGYPEGEYDIVDSLKMNVLVDGETIQADSIWILHLTVHPTYRKDEIINICDNDTVTWQKTLYVGNQFKGTPAQTTHQTLSAGSYQFEKHYDSQYVCDSAFFVTINVHKTFYQKEDSIVCQGDPFVWTSHEGHTFVDEDGDPVQIDNVTDEYGEYTFIDHLYNTECTTCTDGNGCDSIFELHVTVNPSYKDNRTVIFKDTICTTDVPYIWAGHDASKFTFNTSTTINDTITTTLGCDSVVTLQLTVLDNTDKETTITLCKNSPADKFGIQQHFFSPKDSVPGTYTFVQRLTVKDRCSYNETLIIHLHPTYDIHEFDTICQVIDGTWAWSNHGDRDVWSKTAQQSVKANVLPIGEAGQFTYVDSLLTKTCPTCEGGGCDSIITLQLLVLPSYHFDTTAYMSDEETLTWEGVTYGGLKTTAQHTITVTKDTVIEWSKETIGAGTYHCDSTRVLYLRIGKVFRDTLRAISCGNEPYTWIGKDHAGQDSIRRVIQPSEWGTNTSFYTSDNHKTQLEFDSIYYLELTILPYYPVTSERTHHDSICQGSTYEWANHNRHLYLTNKNKWIENPKEYVSSLPVGLYIFHDSIGTMGEHNCDSVWALQLRVDSVYNQTAEYTICENDTLHWENRLYVGQYFEGSYNDADFYQVIKDLPAQEEYKDDTVHHTVHGCDSTWNLLLHIRPSYPIVKETDTTYVHICDNDTYKFVDEKTYNANGEWVISSHKEGDNRINRQVLLDTIKSNAFDCDSAVAHVIYIHPTYLIQQYDTVCRDTVNTSWEWTDREGRTIYSKSTNQRIAPTAIPINIAGNYVYVDSTLTRSCTECPDKGCDSVMILNLTVLPSYYYDTTIMISSEETATWEGITYGGVATNKDHDITVTKDTVITKHWDTYVAGSNLHCDSTRELHLRIGKVFRDTLRAISCGNEPYTWIGKDHAGQDSIRRVIQPSDWGTNTSFYTSDNHKTQLEFDSIYYLELTILPYYPVTSERTHNDSICQGSTYEWSNHDRPLYLTNKSQWITNPKEFVATLPVGLYTFHDSIGTMGEHNCDSVWALQLRVDSVYNQTAEYTICENDTLHWENRLYVGQYFEGSYNDADFYQVIKDLPAQEGYKDDTIHHTVHGCDSTWNLLLHIRPSYPTVRETDTTYVHICDNDTYKFVDDKTYNANGEWVISSHKEGDTRINRQVLLDTIKSNAFECDSAVAHVIYIHPTYLIQQYDTVCQDTINTSWKWTNRENRTIYSTNSHQRIASTAIPINIAGNYVYVDSTLTRSCSECPDKGCDSVMVLNLTVLPSYKIDIRRTMSDEDSIHWEGTTYMGTKCPYIPAPEEKVVIASESINTYSETYPTHLVGTYSCDSTRILTLRIGKVFRDTTYDFVCDNCIYEWQNVPTQDGGTKSIFVNGKDIQGEYTYRYDSLTTILGFDSIYVLKLFKMPTYHLTLQDTVCQNTAYEWAAHEHLALWDVVRNRRVTTIATDEPGWFTFVDSLKTQTYFTDPHIQHSRTTACDSIWTLTLYVPPTYRIPESLTICDNDTVRWQHRIYAGDYFNDSTLLKQMVAEQQIDTFIVYTKGAHNDSVLYTSQFGCDSMYVLHLNVLETHRTYLHHELGDNNTTWSFCPSNDWSKDACHKGEDFHVDDYTDPTRPDRHFMFIDTVPNRWGCDSIIYDSVDVYPSYRFDTTVVTCSNATFNWRKYQNLNHRPSGIYYDSLKTVVHGVDSIYVLHLTIIPSVEFFQSFSLCEDDTLDWQYRKIYYRPEYQHQPIDVVARYQTDKGCDSIYNLHISFCRDYDFYDTLTICSSDSIEWRGKWYSVAGDYADSLTTVTCPDCLTGGGCDSVYHLTLYNYPTYAFYETDTVCQDTIMHTEYTWVNQHGDIVPLDQPILINQSGTFRFQKHYATQTMACDSSYILDLVVLPTYKIDSVAVICDNDSIFFHGKKYVGNKAGGEYPAGVYTDTLRFSTIAVPGHACDSTYIFGLIVYPTYDEAVTTYYDICDNETYNFHGHIYNVRGEWVSPSHEIQTFTLDSIVASSHGCDSAVQHIVTVHPTYRIVDNQTICSNETFTWHERSYRFDNDTLVHDSIELKTQTWGCDSIHYLNLTVNQAYAFQIDSVICADHSFTFTWHNTVQDITVEPNTQQFFSFYDSLTTKQTHCDSIFHLDLTVCAFQYDTIYDTICTGDIYTYRDSTWTRGGTYQYLTFNQFNCPEITTLYITEIPPTLIQVKALDVCADASQLKVAFTFSGKRPRSYKVDYSTEAEQYGFSDMDRLPITDDTLYLDMPYHADRMSYIRPDAYSAKLFFQGVCIDSTLTSQKIQFTVRYPSWIIPQHWNDAINILVPELNGGYDFDGYQWLINGIEQIGETKPYYYNPHYLQQEARYSVALRRVGEDYFICSCEMIPNVQGLDPVMPSTPYVAVVPTAVVKENPIVNILSVSGGEYELYDIYGSLYTKGSYDNLDHNAFQVRLPSVEGTYVFRLYDRGAGKREVKVMVY